MSKAVPQIFSYYPRGKARDLMLCKEPEVLLSGAAGTGKSRACLEKLNLCALKYNKMRGLIARKTRESLSESGLVTFEEKVLTPNDPIKLGAQRRMRQAYSYPNESEIIVGGLDKASKLMSTEYDVIYVQEATELTEDDWESLTTRLRNSVMPYQQIIADCNPASNSHWLKKRAERGGLELLESKHEDNPTLYDELTQTWTPAGAMYIAKLDALTGVRKTRLRHGIWAAAEGMVFEDVWNPSVHIINRFDVPKDWTRYWAVDFGYTNPFVWQEWAEDKDGRLYRIQEIYFTQRLVEDHAAKIKEVTVNSPRPAAVICDHDAEGRATLERHLGVETTAATKTVTEGLQAVAARMRVGGDEKPRVFFLRDSLVERDPKLEDKKKPCCTEEEIEGYVWDTSSNRKKGEEPVKADDHGCDATRYMVAEKDLKDNVNIEGLISLTGQSKWNG
jgi:PBSX family phage terminase large subunit